MFQEKLIAQSWSKPAQKEKAKYRQLSTVQVIKMLYNENSFFGVNILSAILGSGFIQAGSWWSGSVFLVFGVGAVKEVEAGPDPNPCRRHTRLLKHLVQSSLLYGSWRNLFLVSQVLKLPVRKEWAWNVLHETQLF